MSGFKVFKKFKIEENFCLQFKNVCKTSKQAIEETFTTLTIDDTKVRKIKDIYINKIEKFRTQKT